MLKRCRNPLAIGWEYYGGKGVRVCERWERFENFLADMGEPPWGASIDRIDSNGNYEPSNCRWVNSTQQNRNSSHNRLLTFNGETLPLSEWAERTGIKRLTITSRLERGMSIEQALTRPIGRWL